MIKINFVCFGNICRSPMAEFVMKNLVKNAGVEENFYIESSGCHAASGTLIHHNSCRELKKNKVPFTPRTAKNLRRTLTKILTTLFVWIKTMFSTQNIFRAATLTKKFFCSWNLRANRETLTIHI